MNFSEYLVSKKIDEKAFSAAEPHVFFQWKTEFDQMHVNSFTVQKLNLINPLRRKYQLASTTVPPTQLSSTPDAPAPTAAKIAKPVFKPKPKS